MTRKCRYVFTFILLLILLPFAKAQSPKPSSGFGKIQLSVTDPSGRSLRVHGILIGPNERREADSAIDGQLRFPSLSLGLYQLRLSRAGFADQSLNLQIRSTTPVVLHITLSLHEPQTTVNVIAPVLAALLNLPVEDVPIPVQTISAKTIEQMNATDLTEALKRRLNGVYVNENQNNPFQPDVNYRGYTASPLVGSPEGLSVYLDGVRQNQPFGDVVAWDLIPEIAISSVTLIPGSNPVYGLNTLGGALSVQTKDGTADSGFAVSGYDGSFGRRAINAQYGGHNRSGLNWFLAGTLFHEDGWRIQSPSDLRQSFAKLGYQNANTSIFLSGGYTIDDLTGNGMQDIRALRRTQGLNHGYDSVYSIPDRMWQHSPFLTLTATHAVTQNIFFSGNAYLRYIRTNTTNGDINDDSFDQSLYTLSASDKAALDNAGVPYPTSITPQNTPFPYLRCIAQGLELDEPGEKCTGVDTDTADRQHAYGLSGVISWHTTHNQLSAGASWDHGTLTFSQNAQYGYLNPDGLTITRIPVNLDGSTSTDGAPQDSRVNLHGITSTPSLFATDTISFRKFVVNFAGRYNHTTINNRDRLPPVSYRGSLTAVNVFQRFNPSFGVVYKPSSLPGIYFDYSESSRAPTSTELGCADPNFPCSLPNALVSDPPLQQVVSRTLEAGVRSQSNDWLHWNAGFFHTNNDDDLLFVASQQTGYGYFCNFGQTRRLGVEAGAFIHRNAVEAGAEYTFLQATYETAQIIESGSNSSNSNARSGSKGIDDGGTITILPGDRIPEVPEHMLKLYADYHLWRKLSIDADLNLIGASFVRGNENNLHQPDGMYYLGPGQSPGYGVVNLGARYTFGAHYQLFVQMDNLLNRHYYTGGQLASTPYDNSGNFTARPFPAVQFNGDTEYPVRNSTFLSPGAPLTAFGGLKVFFGAR